MINCAINSISYSDCFLKFEDANNNVLYLLSLADTIVTFNADEIVISDKRTQVVITDVTTINGGAFTTYEDLYDYIYPQLVACKCECSSGGALDYKLDINGANANTDIDIGTNDLNAEGLKVTGVDGNGYLTMRHQSSDPAGIGNYTTFWATATNWLNAKIGSGFKMAFSGVGITANRTYTFKDRNGTIADDTDLATKLNVIAKSGADSATITGVTGLQLLQSILIPANSITVNDIIDISFILRFVGIVGAKTPRIHINTSNTLTGSTLLATGIASSAILYTKFKRSATIKSATSTELVNTGGGYVTDDINIATAVSNVNINWTVDQYILLSVTMSSAADSAICSGYSIIKY